MPEARIKILLLSLLLQKIKLEPKSTVPYYTLDNALLNKCSCQKKVITNFSLKMKDITFLKFYFVSVYISI